MPYKYCGHPHPRKPEPPVFTEIVKGEYWTEYGELVEGDVCDGCRELFDSLPRDYGFSRVATAELIGFDHNKRAAEKTRTAVFEGLNELCVFFHLKASRASLTEGDAPIITFRQFIQDLLAQVQKMNETTDAYYWRAINKCLPDLYAALKGGPYGEEMLWPFQSFIAGPVFKVIIMPERELLGK